jgi:F-type H+-transporting ATPase subunit delta
MISAVANRYARALADVVGPAGDYRAMLAELENFAAAYDESADLRDALESPMIPPPKKREILDAILLRLGATSIASNFFRVLLANYRLPLIGGIVEAFRKVSNRRLGIVEVRIAAARDLAESEREALRDRFARLTAHQVEIEFSRDEALVGGLLAQIESTVYDGSVRGYLERIGRQLMAS